VKSRDDTIAVYVVKPCVISGFRYCVNEIFTLLGSYAAYIGSYIFQSTLRNIPEERRSHR